MLDLNAPVVFTVEVTNECNQSCFGCSNVFTHKNESLSPENWKIILEKIKPYARTIRFSGGEPTLHPEFFDILDITNKAGISFSIFTNGLWEDKVEVIKKLKNFSNFSSFLVSFHGLGSDSFSKFSGKDFSVEKYEKIIENIKYAAECGFEVCSSTVIGANNYMELEPLSNFLLGLGVKSLVFERYLGEDIPGISLKDDQLKFAISKLDRLRNSGYPIILGNCIPQCYLPSSSMGCCAGVAFGVIDLWGNMKPCAHTPKVLGNLLNDKIENIWKGVEAKKWRRNVSKDCLICKYSYICAGGCRANAEVRGSKKDPLIIGRIYTSGREEPIPVMLNEELIPELKADMRKEDNGYLLINSVNSFIFIDKTLFKIIEFIKDSKTDLRQIEKKFGRKGLSFIYSLYARGFLIFHNPQDQICCVGDGAGEKVKAGA